MQLIDDRYELLEVIASGGMATVWRARDTRLDRLVAVKRPHPAPASDDYPRRLAREARAAASLSHPNLITVYDVGSDDSGPYLVMELVDGPTILEASDEIDAAAATDIGAHLADALTAIHAAGMVHRDVKPANIILSERGPLLTDFGIALDPNSTSEITDPGKVVATPSYAAPEVLAGAKPTPASDVFSLAVTIDELVRKDGAALPSRELEAVLSPALSASPEDRPSAADFGAALRRVAPTVTLATSGDSTLVMEPSPAQHDHDDDDAPRRAVPAWMWAVGALAVAAAGLTLIGLALSDTRTPADAAATAQTTTTTIAETTTTSLPTTTTSLPITTAASSLQSSVAQTRGELESVLLQPPRGGPEPARSRGPDEEGR
jgi:hypothetical protein